MAEMVWLANKKIMEAEEVRPLRLLQPAKVNPAGRHAVLLAAKTIPWPASALLQTRTTRLPAALLKGQEARIVRLKFHYREGFLIIGVPEDNFMNSPEDLQNALKQLAGLPAIPHIAKKILSLKIATDEGEQALLELIEKDPPIMSKLIGLANSPLYGAGREILSLNDAAALLGSKRVKMIALSFAMMSTLTRKLGGLLDIDGLWKHSLSVTMTMNTLADFMPIDRRPPVDEIYLGGLLHDIGFMVLDYLDPQLSDEFHARLAAKAELTIEEVEAQMLGMNHCELGAELARHWCLPENIISMLRYHHSANDERATGGQPLVAMASLAGKLLPTFGITD